MPATDTHTYTRNSTYPESSTYPEAGTYPKSSTYPEANTIAKNSTYAQAMHYRKLDCTLTDQRLRPAQAANDILLLPFDATQAALHTAVQTPINSLTQMIAPDYLPNVQIIDAPGEVQELSPRWHAQQIGQALGAAADIGAIEIVSRGAIPPALIGACYDGLLRPVESTNAKNQWGERLKNATTGALGFGTLYASNRALGAISKNLESATWKSLAQNTMLTTTLSGIPAGLVTTALASGKTWHDFEIGTYTSVFTGLGLGAVHAGMAKQAAGKQQNDELEALRAVAVTDHLTGLGNRRGSDAALKKEFDRSVRTGKPLSLIYGDLDGFKKVNDHLSHDEGDKVLVQVGRLLQQVVRQYDHVGRTGGDEFTLVLPDTDETTAQALAKRLEQDIKLQVGPGDNRHAVGISLGVVTRRQDEHCLADFHKRADDEMYQTKRARKQEKDQFNL